MFLVAVPDAKEVEQGIVFRSEENAESGLGQRNLRESFWPAIISSFICPFFLSFLIAEGL
jgi:hypothetical protein